MTSILNTQSTLADKYNGAFLNVNNQTFIIHVYPNFINWQGIVQLGKLLLAFARKLKHKV